MAQRNTTTDHSDSRFARTMNRFFDWVADDDDEDEEIVRVHVEHHIHDRSIKERLYIFMIRDIATSFWLRLLRFSVKFASCILFVAMAITGDPYCADDGMTRAEPRENCSKWVNLVWVERPIYFWALQCSVAAFCLMESTLLVYINYSGGKIWAAFDVYIVLDILVGVPFLLPIFHWPLWKLWVPTYLNCWSAKFVIQRMFYDFHRSSHSHRYARERKLLMLFLTVFCLVFTCGCTVHHLQKIDEPDERWDLFVSFWFIVVTFSTVGYGKIAPELWSTRLFVIVMIIVALVLVPKQVNDYLEIRKSQRRQGEATAFAVPGRHVVVCATELRQSDLKDFLGEFFAYKERLQDFTVVILSPTEMSEELKLLIQIPLWSKRVLYLQGSALKEQDLMRARVREAEGCFLLVNRRTPDRNEADKRTVLRAWSIFEVSPCTPLFVQILLPENKPLVSFARAVLCEDELKYALLANNCYCRGISTLVTILLHTSREKSGSPLISWHRLYGSCSGNEIYRVVLGESRVFRTFAGKNFLFTSVIARRKYGITLIGVRRDNSDNVLLNPGRRFILHLDDTCYYLSIAREENSKFVTEQEALPRVVPALRRTLAFAGILGLDLTLLNITADESKHKDTDIPQGSDETETHGADSHLHPQEGLQPYCQYLQAAADNPSRPTNDVAKDIRRVRAIAIGKGSGSSDKHHSKKEEEHFEGRIVFNEKQDTGVLGSLIRASFPLGLSAAPTAMNRAETAEVKIPDEDIVEEDHVSHTDIGNRPSRDFHGMDALAVKAAGQRKKRGFLHLPSHPAAHHGSTASLSSRTASDYGSERMTRGSSRSSLARQRSSHGGSQSTLAQPPSVVAPVVLDDVVEENELSDEERDELQELEVGSMSESSGIVDDAPAEPEPGVPWVSQMQYPKGLPSHTPYIGMDRFQCHLLPERTPLCCLHLIEPCEHSEDHGSSVSRWKTGSVIVSGAYTCNGLYHFILPLRAHYLPRCTLKPIVLLLENEPEKRFLEAISCFPDIYYLTGSVSSIDDLLRAGVLSADTVVVARSYDNVSSEVAMVDAGSIIALQKIFRLFPNANVVTELSSRLNLRFTKFSWNAGYRTQDYDPYSIAAMKKRCAKLNFAPTSDASSGALSRDHMTYMFRPAFAAGNVFTASMLDTLLYQSYVKPWIITLIEQLLGCRSVNGSGFLWQIPVDESLVSLKNYGRVCQRLAKKFGLLVFGIYRTHTVEQNKRDIPRQDTCRLMLRDRMQLLGIEGEPPEKRDHSDSFVLVNPKPDLPMQTGDRLYVICPGKYDASDNSDAENSPDFPEEVGQPNAGTGDMPLLPSYECDPLDVKMHEAKGKGSPGSRHTLWSIGRFLFRRHRSQRHNRRIRTEGTKSTDLEEKWETEKGFSVTTV